jgi:hypothetical protein
MQYIQVKTPTITKLHIYIKKKKKKNGDMLAHLILKLGSSQKKYILKLG